MRTVLLNATIAATTGAPSLPARYTRFRLLLRPLWQNNGDATPRHLGFAPATIQVDLHFARETHPDPAAVRATLCSLAGGPVQLTLDSGLRFLGHVELLGWEETCDDDGRFVTAVADLTITGKEVAGGAKRLARN